MRFLKSQLIRIKNRAPKRLRRSPAYFKVLRLLSQQEKGLDISARIDERLASVIRNAVTSVPFYKNLNLNLNPKDIKGQNAREALSCFPLLDRQTIMKNPRSFVSEKFDISNLIPATSGGSTGVGIKVWRTREELQAERAFFDFKWGKIGYKTSSKLVRIGSEALKRDDEFPCSRQGDKLLISAYHFNQKWIKTIYEEIIEFKAEYIHSYPSCVEYLIRYLMENKLTIPGLKGLFLASERIPERVLTLCQDLFGPQPVIFFHYGLAECTNLAWGSFEKGKISYTFERTYGLTEKHVQEDGRHEIIGTSLWIEAMPFIRYRTQDYGKVIDGMVGNLDGRSSEFLITKSGGKIPGFTISIDQYVWDYVEIFQVVQNKRGEVEFWVVPRPSYSEEVGARILRSQQERWGQFFDLKIVVQEKIQKTSSGKLRLIVNNIKREGE